MPLKKQLPPYLSRRLPATPSGRIFLSEKVVESTDNANEDEDQDEEEDRDEESMDFSKSRIQNVPTSKKVPKSLTMNIDLTGDFASPIASDSSSTLMI